MSGPRKLYEFLMAASMAHAKWDYEVSMNILRNRKKLLWLLAMAAPILAVSALSAADLIGGKTAYAPAHYTNTIFLVSIAVGLAAGLITGCIGAGGGFIITPALMAAGVKGILAVGTDVFHIFAKAIMGTTVHKKLGNVSVKLAIAFLVGSGGGRSSAAGSTRLSTTRTRCSPRPSSARSTRCCWASSASYRAGGLLEVAQRHGGRGGHGAHGGPSGDDGARDQAPEDQHPADDHLRRGLRRSPHLLALGRNGRRDCRRARRDHGRRRRLRDLPDVRLRLRRLDRDHRRHRHPADHLHRGPGFDRPVRDLRLRLLHAGDGDAPRSLIGIQVGSADHKGRQGIHIRGFYAISIIAGFINRVTTLPKKFTELEVVNFPKAFNSGVETVGNVIFWLVVGFFRLLDHQQVRDQHQDLREEA